MEAREAITAHSKKQHQHLVTFAKLDQQREDAIEEALQQCMAGRPFTVDRINEITDRINRHAKQGISPTRKYVTVDMVKEYAERQKNQSNR